MLRNARLYPRYAALHGAMFWLPVFFLYFSRHLPLVDVLRLEALYYLSVVTLEVPTGYASDRFGRRPTLVASAASFMLAYALFAAATTFAGLAAAQVALAAGIALASGTDTSLHYDSLVAAGRAAEYGAREALAARAGLAAAALAAVAGGAVGLVDLRLAYVLSFVAAAGQLAVVWRFAEPPRASDTPAGRTFGRQLAEVARHARTPALLWLSGYMVLMIVLNHVPYELYQPYLGLLAGGTGADAGAGRAPLAAGLHMAAAMLVAAWAAGRSIDLRDRFGTRGALLGATALQLAIIGAMAVALSWPGALLAVLRTAPRGLMTAPWREAVAPRVPSDLRATYLSVQSLAGRLAFAGALFGLSHLAEPGAAYDWPAVARILRVAAAVGTALALALALFGRRTPLGRPPAGG